MSPMNLLTQNNVYCIDDVMIDTKQIEAVTNTLCRAISEPSPFYFYINQQTIEAKLDFGEVLRVTKVKGGHVMKFKMNKISRLAIAHCAKRVIEVFG